MFRKIRNKILLLNMVMVSTVVVVAFVVIFTITYARVRSENHEKLRFAIPMQQMAASVETVRQGAAIYVGPKLEGGAVSGFSTRISPDAGLSFALLVDKESNVVEINSMVDLLPESYMFLAARALESPQSDETITIEGRSWQYMVSPITVFFGEALNRPMTTFTGMEEMTHIRFLDVTDSYRTLRSLALMLCGSTLVILAVFFFISYYFANRAIRPMEEAWEKQSRFITDASHELKTPLSVINANCSVLYAGKEETVESQLKWVDSIMRASDRMTGLVGSLLSLVSLEDKQLDLISAPFPLSEAAEDAASEIEAAAFEKNLIIKKDIAPGIIVESDKEHICKVFSILLDNAVKYANDGGEVIVSLVKEKRHAVYTVRNTGEGIPAEDLPRVFDRFFRGDPARSSATRGYGLGLAIAKEITEQLGVSLTVESVVGRDTGFNLVFEAN